MRRAARSPIDLLLLRRTAMSALGQKRTLSPISRMSALRQKRTLLRANIHTEGTTPRSISAEVHGTLLGDRLGTESSLKVFINTVGAHVIRNWW